MTYRAANTETSDSAYRSLYKLGGAAALLVALLTLSEVIVLSLYPQPGTMQDWFALFQSNQILALLDLWLLEVPMYIMFILAFLALFVVLKKSNPGLMTIALVFVLVGSGIFLATNNPFSMLTLSKQYTAATTDMERSALLAAGQMVLVNTSQRAVGGFNMGLFLVSIAGLIVSTVMLQNGSFSKSIAYVGIAAHVLSLADYLRQALTSSAIVTLLIVLPNALLLITWYIMIGRRLYQFGKTQA